MLIQAEVHEAHVGMEETLFGSWRGSFHEKKLKSLQRIEASVDVFDVAENIIVAKIFVA